MGRDAPTDTDLIRRFRTGEAAAFEILVDRYKRPLHVLLHRITSDGHAADDLLQECFLRLWNHMANIDESGSLFGYLRRAAVNLGINHLRGRSRRSEAMKAAAVQARAVSALTPEVPGDSDVSEITRCLGELPADQRICLSLRVQEDMSYAEIAESTGVAVGTVMSRLARARSALRDKLKARAVL